MTQLTRGGPGRPVRTPEPQGAIPLRSLEGCQGRGDPINPLQPSGPLLLNVCTIDRLPMRQRRAPTHGPYARSQAGFSALELPGAIGYKTVRKDEDDPKPRGLRP